MFSEDVTLSESAAIDRDAKTRTDEVLLQKAWADPRAKVFRVREGQLATFESGEGLEIQAPQGELTERHAYLGRADDIPYFAEFSVEDESASGGGWVHPFALHDSLNPIEREAMTMAIALENWHRTAAFSGRTGEPTWLAQAGWMRTDAHGNEYFPRTDPAVIVVIEHDNRILLGSNVLWESGRFSLLAGFIEAGESAEQAVVREVQEEAGVTVADVRYVASQAWPFPRSLMLGFFARLAPGTSPDRLAPDPTEISELRWFTREELRSPAAGIRLPQQLSIARRLIDQWVAQGEDNSPTNRNQSD